MGLVTGGGLGSGTLFALLSGSVSFRGGVCVSSGSLGSLGLGEVVELL
jgi:hypothetical protein